MDNNRLLIALVLMLGIMFLYNKLLEWRHPELMHRNGKPTQQVKPPGGGIGSAGPVAVAPERAGPPAGAAQLRASPVRRIEIDTRLYTATITTNGGRLESLRLKAYRQSSGPNSPPYEMIAGGDRLPLGLVVDRAGAAIDDGEVTYTAGAPQRIDARGSDAEVTLTGTTADGIKLRKTLKFPSDGYVFEIDGEAIAAASSRIDGIGLQLSRPLKANEGYSNVPELQADVGNKVINEAQKSLEKGVPASSGPITYAGFGDRYFLSVFMPITPVDGTLVMDYTGNEADARMMFSGRASVSSRIFMGPKELDVLEAVNPALSKSINFGWASMIALPFLKLLKLFYRIAPNYGIAIILLTVLVRLATLPMSIKGQRSMMRMQRLQPQVERIREKFKGDQERLNREMVDLYKRNHVNPLGGCLPMAVQLPVFIGLYEALLNAIELRHASFIGWISDLSAPDCLPIPGMPAVPMLPCNGIPVLVLLMAVTAFVQQWMAPKQPDPSQQKMMMYMPVMFSVIFINLPAGLTLYYFFSNLLGIVQQYVLNREFQQPTAAT